MLYGWCDYPVRASKANTSFSLKHAVCVPLSPWKTAPQAFHFVHVRSDGLLLLLMADWCANIHPLYKSQVQISNVCVKQMMKSHFKGSEVFRKQSLRLGTRITLEPAECFWTAAFRKSP